MAEIDDLYVILRAHTTPLTEGFAAAGAAGERLTAGLAAANAKITADVEAMSSAATASLARVDESALVARIEYDKLAASTMAASAKMEAATARAAASNERLGASMAATSGWQTKAAGAFGLVALAAAAGGVELMKMAGNFESATTRLVTSAGETNANLDMVRKGILGMAGQVGDSADELARAMYTVESGGQHGADGLKVLRAAAEGAKTENADLKTVADAVTSVLVDYHLKASDAAMVTTKLVAATSAGKTTFQELAGAMSAVLPKASAAHISLSDILGDMASMTVHGMSAQQAAQNLSDTISHMQRPTNMQAKELALLGINTSQLADDLKSKGLSGTLQLISDRIRNLMPPGSSKVILDLKTALNGLSGPVHDLGMRLLEGSISMKDYGKAAGALDPIHAKQAASFGTLAGSMHRIGDVQMTAMKAMQSYAGALGQATGDSAGLNVALMLTGENAGTTSDAVKTVSRSTTEAGGHVKGWSEIQHTFNQKLADAKAGMGALAIEVGTKLLPPATKLLGVMADLAGWLSKHQTLSTLLAVALGVLAIGFTVAAIAVWAMNLALLANPITWIILAIVAAVAVVVIGIYELVKHWKTVWGAIKDVAMAVWHFLVDVWHAIAKETAKIWNDDIVGPIVDAWNTVGHWLDVAVDFFKKLPGRIVHALAELPGLLGRAVSTAFDKMLYALGYGIGTVIKLMLTLPGQILNIVKDLWNDTVNLVGRGVDAVVAFFKALPGRAASAWNDLWSTTTSLFTKGINATAGFVSHLPARIGKFFDDTRSWAVHTAAGLINDVGAWFEKLPGRAVNAVTSMGKGIIHALAGAGSWLVDAGRNIIMGLIHGIQDAIGAAIDAVTHGMGQILSGAKDALGIHSPSQVFAQQVGQWIPHGIAMGIQGAAGVAKDAVAALAGAMAGSISLNVPVGVAATGSAGVVPAAAGGFGGPALGGRYLAPTARSTGSGQAPVVHVDNHVWLGDQEIQQFQIRTAQRVKLRNGTSQMT